MNPERKALDNASMERQRSARLYTVVWSAGGAFHRWFAARAIAAAGVPRTILDVACGPGFVPVALARRAPGASVAGLDISPFMLEEARGRVDSAGLADRVEIVEGSAYDMPFPDAEFDLVTMSNALHMFDDVPRLFSEVARVLKPGGVFFAQAFARDAALPMRAFGWANTRLFQLMRSGLEGLGLVFKASLTAQEVEAVLSEQSLLEGKVRKQWGYLLMMELRKGERLGAQDDEATVTH